MSIDKVLDYSVKTYKAVVDKFREYCFDECPYKMNGVYKFECRKKKEMKEDPDIYQVIPDDCSYFDFNGGCWVNYYICEDIANEINQKGTYTFKSFVPGEGKE